MLRREVEANHCSRERAGRSGGSRASGPRVLSALDNLLPVGLLELGRNGVYASSSVVRLASVSVSERVGIAKAVGILLRG
jgi:hypothetical protein